MNQVQATVVLHFLYTPYAHPAPVRLVAGQEIMTAGKVTLRMNAVVTDRVVDARQAVTVAGGATQSLHREAQVALRAVVGARDLDSFLTGKGAVTGEFEVQVSRRAAELGLEVVSVGVRDLILPGDMKDLMNKVTEAKKAAESILISRREETDTMRRQANTARCSPTAWVTCCSERRSLGTILSSGFSHRVRISANAFVAAGTVR